MYIYTHTLLKKRNLTKPNRIELASLMLAMYNTYRNTHTYIPKNQEHENKTMNQREKNEESNVQTKKSDLAPLTPHAL